MQTIVAVAQREFLAYFRSPIAYIFVTTFLVLTYFLFFRGFFLMGEADLRPFFSLMPWIFLFYIPAVAMGKWAEERRQGTLELLLTLPVADRDVVLGKFFAGLGLIATAIMGTLPLAVTVSLLGNLDWGPVIGGYLGLLFLGGAYLSVGLVVSSGTQNQIIAFIVSVIAAFVLLIIGEPIVTVAVPKVLVTAIQYFGLTYHFESIRRGVIDSSDLLYYLSVIGFFLWVNCRIVRERR
ncbi:MAG: ABC transporter permease subunit [Deltaproteobacteria bacterium]|nr:ABC transporter permease subunit [Deltaproteobacteria bacterium]